MRGSVADVDANLPIPEPMEPTEAGAGRTPPVPGGRFTYPSGARPLDGYTIKRGVGHGGFGEVYYATSDAGKDVALKLIRRNLDVELRGIRQCLNLKHPNLLAIFDIREDGRQDNWVVMEYITGACLQDVLGAHPQGLSTEQALAWFHGMAAGVACLHDHGIVHRDLKPGNIFSDEGLVKIGDYGLSKYISCSRRSGHTESVGTVHYMAPEVANGRYGKQIDIYALGVILYEMLTGRVPFDGESVGEVLMKHLTATPDVSMLAEPYRTVVAKALEKDPQRRYQSVGQMLAQLPVPARPYVHSATLASGSAPPVPAAVLPAEEPLWAAARTATRQVYQAWNESNFSTPTRIALVLGAVFVFLTTAQVILPMAFTLGMLYLGYRAARWVYFTFIRPPARAASPLPAANVATHPSSPPPVKAPADSHLPRWYRSQPRRERPQPALVLKPPRQRAAELLGSLLGGSLVAMIMSLVMVMLASFQSAVMPKPEQAAWLVLVGIAGTWAVMIPAKFWEGSRGEAVVRAFLMMVVGLGLGVVAYQAAVALDVSLPYDPQLSTLRVQLPPNFYDSYGRPLLFAHMAFFGTLMLLVRWWRQADPLRRTRLSLFAIAWSVLVAVVTTQIWQFPPHWPIMVACVMSVAVQLASPWVHPRDRIGPEPG